VTYGLEASQTRPSFTNRLYQPRINCLLAGSVLHLRRNYRGTVATDVVSLRDKITT